MNHNSDNLSDQINAIENSLKASVPFEYPKDEPEPENKEDRVVMMLRTMANYVLPTKDARLTLVALLYAFGVDLSYIFGCSNTETALAKKLGVAKQTLHNHVILIRKDFGPIHSTTRRHAVTSQTYKNNAKKFKN